MGGRRPGLDTQRKHRRNHTSKTSRTDLSRHTYLARPKKQREESHSTSTHAAPASENQQSQPSHGNDLIDFGQSDGTPSTNAATPIPAYQAPADLQAAQTVNGGQQQKDLENTLRSTSNERTNGGALIDFSDDLK